MNIMDISALEQVMFFKVIKVFVVRTQAQEGSSMRMCQGGGATCSAQAATGTQTCYGQTGHVTAGKEGGMEGQAHV